MASVKYRETNLLPAGQLLAVLARIAAGQEAGQAAGRANDLAPLVEAGLRVIRYDRRDAYLLIPDIAASSALIVELEAAGCAVGPPEQNPGAASQPGFAAGVAAVLDATAVALDDPGVAPGDLADPIPDEALVMVAGGDDRLQDQMRAFTASVPAFRLDGVRDGGEEHLVFHVADTPNLESTLGGFAAGPWGSAARCFECFSAGGALVCFSHGRRPAKAALRACAGIFSALLPAVPDGGGRRAFVVEATDDGAVTVLPFELPRRTPAALARKQPAVRVIERLLVTDGRIIDRLRQSIADAGDGYAVRLDRLPAAARPRSAESIREEIGRLEAEWQIAAGLQEPQVTLLRFDHAQLPAMVDALRRLPVSGIDQVSYAFSAASDFPIGYHYLKYSTRDVQPLQPLIECVWLAQCGGGAMVHWVDPAWARIYRGGRGKVRSLVMVPEDHVFSPAFYTFRPEDMDRHLWETIDAWSGAGEALRDRGRPQPEEPIYVFSSLPSAGGGPARVRVEILDGTRFTPIAKQIGFINDYLLVVDHVDIADFIRTGAEEARRQEIAGRLSDAAAAQAAEMAGRANDLEQQLEAQLGSYLTLLNKEVALLGKSIEQQGAQVRQLTLEADVIVQHVAAACGERAALRFAVSGIPGDFAEIAEELKEIETGLTQVVEAANGAVDATNTRLEWARRRLAELEARLRR
jgi:hypothetical protein